MLAGPHGCQFMAFVLFSFFNQLLVLECPRSDPRSNCCSSTGHRDVLGVAHTPFIQAVSLLLDIHVWSRFFRSHDVALTHLWEFCLCWYNHEYNPQTRKEPKGAFRWTSSWSEFMAYDLMSFIGEESNHLDEHGMAWVTNEAMVRPTK